MAPSKNDKSAARINGRVTGFGLKVDAGCAFTQPTSNCLVQSGSRKVPVTFRALFRDERASPFSEAAFEGRLEGSFTFGRLQEGLKDASSGLQRGLKEA